MPDDPTIAYKHRLLFGAAPEAILRLAEEEQVDLIVMGSHGRGWLGRLLMGSVAENVMRHATCPVLIVKPPGTRPEESASSSPAASLAGNDATKHAENPAKRTIPVA